MNAVSPIQKMFEKYQCSNNDERRSAIKEIVQEITLVALSRAGFFNRAAFYGGTCLRLFHGSERFSEDLDFSLMESDPSFDLGTFIPAIRDELGAYGFEMDVMEKHKTQNTPIQSAFIKGGTLIHFIKVASINPPVAGVSKNELLKIKIEIDTNPPAGAGYEIRYRLSPTSYSVRLYDLPSLFAGKIHALLCRNWKQRAKGRDFYDYLWYLSHEVSVNKIHLESRMIQSGHWQVEKKLTLNDILLLLDKRFSSVDFKQLKEDILPFIKDPISLDLWDKNFFSTISHEYLKENPKT